MLSHYVRRRRHPRRGVGTASISQDADVTAGTRELESAALMAPDSPDALIHAGLLASPAGTDGRSPNRHEHALELHPLGLEIGTLTGQVFYRLREYDRAITQLQKTLDVEPVVGRGEDSRHCAIDRFGSSGVFGR